MRYEHFTEEVESAGLEARRCTAIHWQIRGGKRLVNVWPASRRGFRFQADGEKSRDGKLADAITLAGPPERVTETTPPWESAETTKPERVGLIRWLWRLLW